MFRKRESAVPEEKKTNSTSIMVDGEEVSILCNYDDHGVSCSKRGTIAGSTNGKGPWYCRDHAWVVLLDRTPKSSEKAEWKPIKAELKAIIGGREPGQDDEENAA